MFDLAGNPDAPPAVKTVKLSVNRQNQNFTFDSTPVLDNVSVTVVPEPSTSALSGIALVMMGLGYTRRRRQMANA